MEIKNSFKIDSHVHIYTSYLDKRWEPGPRDLETFTKEFSKRGLNASTLTNFNDERYELFIETAKNLPKGWDFKEYKRGAIVTMPDKTDPNGNKFYWFKSQEIPTEKGHVLFLGTLKGKHIKPFKSLEETLKKADPLNTIVADHAEAVLSGINPLGIGIKNLLRYKKYFHAAEWNSSCWFLFPESNKRIEKLCKEENIPLIANSDSYGFTLPLIGGFPFYGVGNTFTEFEKGELDLTEIDHFLYSLNKNIISNNFNIQTSRANIPSMIEHAILAISYSRLKRLGFNIKHHCDKK
ncbi:MAG: hypothetical protein AABX30_01600 [Nanoarchaeota archaeon]